MEGYNISIIGKSGVGKSSLLNYLFGEKVAETGSGRPQTTKGFHLKSGKIAGKKVNIYDSWGLEPGKAEDWLKDFNDFQKNKQQETNIKKWLHTVIYCVSAEGKRIEEFEKNILKEIRKESLNPVVVVTKADSKGAEEFIGQVETILGSKPVLVSSIKKEKGFGKIIRISEPFGKVNLIKKIKESASNSLDSRIRFLLKQRINVGAQDLKYNLISAIKFNLDEKSIIGYVSKDNLRIIQQILEDIVKERSTQISKEIASIAEDAKEFYEGDLSDLLNTRLEASMNYHINDNSEEDNLFTSFSSLSSAFAVSTLIPALTLSIFAIPITLVGAGIFGSILEKLSPELRNGIPTYNKEKVYKEFCSNLKSPIIQGEKVLYV